MLNNQSEIIDIINTCSQKKVLIADDDLPTRMLLSAAIKQWGYEVIEASDGEQAWNILNSDTPPTLLVVDWLMPKMDGIELINRIKTKLPFYSYIILLTQVSGTFNVIKALEVGADEFLTKPFNMSELKIRLQVGANILDFKNTLISQNHIIQLCMLSMALANNIPTDEANMSKNFDMKRLHDIYGNDSESIINFIKTFVTSTIQLINANENAIQQKDSIVAKNVFHSIRGSSGNSGALVIYDLSAKAESAIMENNWDACWNFLHEIKNCLQNLKHEYLVEKQGSHNICSNQCILIVDDNIINLKLTQIVLKNSGFKVVTAIDADQALSMVDQYLPSLILMDIQLPNKNGLELTRIIKSNPKTKNILIVALTANAMKGDREKALLAGCDSYITKPFDTKMLPKTISELFERTNLR